MRRAAPAWRAVQARVLGTGFWYLEGPRWHDGRLWVSDLYGHRVLSLTATGPHTVIETVCRVPSQPSGLGWQPDGALLIVSMLDRRLCRWTGRALETVAHLTDRAGGTPNDMVVDSRGRAFIGSIGEGSAGTAGPSAVVRIDPSGVVTPVASGLAVPNGAVLDAEERILWVAETEGHRILRFDIFPDGSLSEPHCWADLSHTDLSASPLRPDGIAIDAEGGIWAGLFEGRGVIRLDAQGRLDQAIDTTPMSAYAVALGGPSGRTLFMCVAPPGQAFDPERAPVAELWAVDVDIPAPSGGG